MSSPNQQKVGCGVIYAPFQIPRITYRHKLLIDIAFDTHQLCVIALPVKRFPPTKTSPLDFDTRKAMIGTSYPNVAVVPIPDQKYAAKFIQTLHSAIPAIEPIHLYADSKSVALYKEHGGTWETTVCELHADEQDCRQSEEFLKQSALDLLRHPEEIEKLGEHAIASVHQFAAESYRSGMVVATQKQFTHSYPTVDVAIRRITNDGRRQLLLGRKPEELLFRFPGGFVDPSDLSYESTALREGFEETGAISLSKPRYVASRRVDDWRYRGEADGIKTILFQCDFLGADAELKAGDDLEEIRWFDEDYLVPEQFEPEHRHLLEMLLGEAA